MRLANRHQRLVRMDLGEVSEVRESVETVARELGRIDILVNNAA